MVVASVHSYMKMERAEMTDRILAAIENPYTQIIAHPTGRLVLRREAFEYDMEKIFDACRQSRRGHGVQRLSRAPRPERRSPARGQAARRENRHLHRLRTAPTSLTFMQYGVRTARRGWIEKRDVLNALPLDEFLAALRKKPKPDQGRRPMQRRELRDLSALLTSPSF